jgi:hypothetical protein
MTLAPPTVQQAGYDDQSVWTRPMMRPPVNPDAKLNTCSIIAFVCALVIWPGVPSIVLGFIGNWQIDQSQGRERGKALALWAIVLGFIELVVFVVVIVHVIQHTGTGVGVGGGGGVGTVPATTPATSCYVNVNGALVCY